MNNLSPHETVLDAVFSYYVKPTLTLFDLKLFQVTKVQKKCMKKKIMETMDDLSLFKKKKTLMIEVGYT